MKRVFQLTALVVLLSLTVGCSKKSLPADYEIVPLPDRIDYYPEINPFHLTDGTRILYPENNEQMKRNAEFLAEYIEKYTSIEVSVVPAENFSSQFQHIRLAVNSEIDCKDSYLINISEREFLISGASEAGVFYGVQAVRKMLPIEEKIDVIFNCATIEDAPEFSYRGAMLDVSRHFFSVEEVKEYIDILALHQINVFHWHLTDDQGWRIEIPGYPLLTQISSNRKQTIIGKTEEYDGKPYGGYYTVDEVKEIIKYASDRYIDVIPEIDMPGHMLAALAAYPEYGCTGGPYEVGEKWGVSDDVLCVGNDRTVAFVQDILSKVLEIFPSEYIHIGGDECPKVRWEKCDVCQAKIRELGIKDKPGHTAEQQLQAYFVRTMQQWLAERGRKLIGWDEIMEGGLAEGATVMAWRSKGEGLRAAKMGNDVIMVPCTHLYFDYYQTADTEEEPIHIGGFSSVKNVYSFDPFDSRLTPEENSRIMGVQGNLWTEYVQDFNMVTYTVLPRMAALSEIQWVKGEKRNYDDFLKRLMHLLKVYEREEYSYATHIFDIVTSTQMDTVAKTITLNLSTVDDADIYYTLDGSEPTASSKLFTQPLMIDRDVNLRAVAIRNEEKGRMVKEDILFNRATACPIRSLNPIIGGYLFDGPQTLVDGKKGLGNYKTGEWIGFYRHDIDLLIDLKNIVPVKEVSFNTLVEKGAWIFDIKNINISVSLDGENYTPVYMDEYEVLTEAYPNGIHTHEFVFNPADCRYLRIQAATEHELPDWHPGAGNEAYVFIDEISVK